MINNLHYVLFLLLMCQETDNIINRCLSINQRVHSTIQAWPGQECSLRNEGATKRDRRTRQRHKRKTRCRLPWQMSCRPWKRRRSHGRDTSWQKRLGGWFFLPVMPLKRLILNQFEGSFTRSDLGPIFIFDYTRLY